MDYYLFHQTIIFITTTIYVPLIMLYLIFMCREKRWTHRGPYALIVGALVYSLPGIIKRYQQYLMGDSCGFPEVITKSQLAADWAMMFALLFMLFVFAFTHMAEKKLKPKLNMAYPFHL